MGETGRKGTLRSAKTGYGTGVADVSQQANSDLSTCLLRRRHVDPNLGRRMEAPDYSWSI